MTVDVYRDGVYEGRVTADDTMVVASGPDGQPDPDEMPMQLLSSFLNSNRPHDWRDRGLTYYQATAQTLAAAAAGRVRTGEYVNGPCGPEIHYGYITIRPVQPGEPPCPGENLTHSSAVRKLNAG